MTFAPIASLHNIGNPGEFFIFYADSASSQLVAYTTLYSDSLNRESLKESSRECKADDGLSATVVPPSGNISSASALAAATVGGIMNVYGVLSVVSGTTTTLMPCRLNPGFLPMNLTTPPMLSGYGLGACSDGNNTGFLFYLAYVNWLERLLAVPGILIGPTPQKTRATLSSLSLSLPHRFPQRSALTYRHPIGAPMPHLLRISASVTGSSSSCSSRTGYPYLDCFRPALKSSLPMPKGSVGTVPGVWRTPSRMIAMCLTLNLN